ncbi:MAG TPA: M13 family metallopeptidase [Acidobacteriota bacterium]|nr:M13 family metallopeptidase [Acidobacteriota bacterium]
MKSLRILLAFSLLLPAAVQPQQNSQTVNASNYLDQYVDHSVNPGEDFFHYAVGKWIKDNPIPSNETSWGVGRVVYEETYQRILKINKEAAADPNATNGTNAQKIGDFWHTALDTDSIEKQDIEPLKPEFDRIAAIHDKETLLNAIAHLKYIGVNALMNTPIFQDEMNSERYALHLYQGGIGLPDRDYYFETDERTTKIRDEYVKHLAKMFKLLGDDTAIATKNSQVVMKIETDLAKASRKLEALRDPRTNYNKMKVSELNKLTPSVNWTKFLEEGNIRNLDTVIVGQPEFFKQVETSLQNESIDNWKTYLRWHLINAYADKLSSKFDNQDFYFYGTILNGTPEQRPRWKRMLDQEESYLGFALGQLYVNRYFSAKAKARYEKLTDEIFAAFHERIKKLDWMSEKTKEASLRKLNTVTKKVGYPEKWRDYSNYKVDRNSFAQNCLRGNIWKSDYAISKLYKPVDRTEWQMTPQTYNAYYNPGNNEIVLPAAIFILPGIQDEFVDDAIVYAYAGGTTIGHEIVHGFDDQGRQFDEKGNLRNWWTTEDEKEFKERAKMIIEQFNNYIAVDKLHVNGDATQGENIADLGGIVLAWDAFKKTEQYKSGEVIGGFTPAQRYFIGWTIGWMNNIRPENLAVRVKTDVHAPSFLRANGPISNMTEFYEAFQVKPGQKMYRPENRRVKIW